MKQIYPGLLRSFKAIFIICLLGVTYISHAQQVSGIVTDFGSYWKSSVTNINPTKPSNSHSLLAFTYNGVQYSTGANDQVLNDHGENFVAGDFWALPVEGITGTPTSDTKVGWGEMKDGVHNGMGTVSIPQMNIGLYLTDGIKGLDLGTCIANLPTGSLTFFVNNVKPQYIGDGIPDIVVSQVADPGGATDRYSFVDSAGNTIGNTKNISFTTITPVGTWTADFYGQGGSGLTLASGFTNTDRPIRLWAADLSEFGITSANYHLVYKFKVQLSGTSDVAFAAYNQRTFNLSTTLPLKFSDFRVRTIETAVKLEWTASQAENVEFFTIERSPDNNHFSHIGDVQITGSSNVSGRFAFTDPTPYNDANYYRLKITDKDGKSVYSSTLKISLSKAASVISAYPNPCGNEILVSHPVATNASVTVYSAGAIAVLTANSSSSKTKLDVSRLSSGVYYLVWQHGNEKISMALLKN